MNSDVLPIHAEILRQLQKNSFKYFIHEVNPVNGLVRDKTAASWPASIAAVGMGLSIYPVGVERGFIGREDAIERTLATLLFFASSDQSGEPGSTGYKGFYFHFLHMQSGKREWECELSSIDTALLMAGILVAAAYFSADTASEQQIRVLAKMLYERVEWPWLLAGKETICHGWTPEDGFLPYHWEGYDEALILYLLALGSPTHAIERSSYDAWCRSYEWKKVFGIEFLYAGPLFIHQMSHIWCDFRGTQDDYMRNRDCDYFENSRRATLIQQRYAIANPAGFAHMGELSWGITASDGPGKMTRKIAGIELRFFDYVARGAPFGPDDGTLAPWAVAASLPFAPEIVAPTLAHFRALEMDLPNPYGFEASFNPVLRDDSDAGIGWRSPYHFGINEGPTVLMIENHRSGMIWSLMRESPYLVRGFLAAGFTGGWLESAAMTASPQ